jgi:hypothetical protein
MTSSGFHSVLLHQGACTDIDDTLEEAVDGLGPEDVVILGANAIDSSGNAALMYGTPLGGKPGRVISGLMAEVKHVLIAVGLEKLIPGSLPDLIRAFGRKDVELSMGIAVGLTPVLGKIITEQEAIPLLAGVRAAVIGKGGILGAEGATTLNVEGERDEVNKILQIVLSTKGKSISGIPESLAECQYPSERCRLHPTCIYKKTGKRTD